MTDRDDSGEQKDPTNSKVGRLIDEYDLHGLGREMEGRWTGENGERDSLRELADLFNRRFLRAALDSVGADTVTYDVDHIYRQLTGDDVSSGVRTEIRNHLERVGINVDNLLDDFVSYQAVRTYLTKYRNVDYEPDRDDDPIEREGQHIRRLRSRTTNVTEDKLRQLRRNGDIEIGSIRVQTDLHVYCEDCGSRYTVSEFLERESCSCEDIRT